MKEQKKTREILIQEYDYILPDEQIAKYPLKERDSSRLLVYRKRKIEETLPNQDIALDTNTDTDLAHFGIMRVGADTCVYNSCEEVHTSEDHFVERIDCPSSDAGALKNEVSQRNGDVEMCISLIEQDTLGRKAGLKTENVGEDALEHLDGAVARAVVSEWAEIAEYSFRDLPMQLPRGAVLVRNNSRVIRARLLFRRETGAQVEVFCLEPIEPSSYELALSSRTDCTWSCMTGNARRWKEGTSLSRTIEHEHYGITILSVERLAHDRVRFSWDNPHYTFGELLEAMGVLPIPPYLNRETEEADLTTYQTVYAEHQGSVAAPTAGLHFTPRIFSELQSQGVDIIDLTLHVGAGTFRPVKVERIGEHDMHRELVVVGRDELMQIRRSLGRIIAVGTTSVRSLESLYHLGRVVMADPDIDLSILAVSQWMPYEAEYYPEAGDVLEALLDYMDRKGREILSFPTAILIAPGYTFRIVHGIITNFHQPHSTLLLLISAFIGEDWRRVYDYALGHGFRFLSYGDSSLLLPR